MDASLLTPVISDVSFCSSLVSVTIAYWSLLIRMILVSTFFEFQLIHSVSIFDNSGDFFIPILCCSGVFICVDLGVAFCLMKQSN